MLDKSIEKGGKVMNRINRSKGKLTTVKKIEKNSKVID